MLSSITMKNEPSHYGLLFCVGLIATGPTSI